MFLFIYNMKKFIIISSILVVGITTIFFLIKRINKLNEQLSISINNEKAFSAENSKLKENNLAFKFTIEQLENSVDSISQEMLEVVNENNIKNKTIEYLQYQLKTYNKVDTLLIRDTIFKNPDFKLDTCLVDKWNKSCLSLSYPNKIILNNTYYNKSYIIVNSKKEPIKPVKCFLERWFTKKHTVLEITVVDENPYVSTKEQRFVEIIK